MKSAEAIAHHNEPKDRKRLVHSTLEVVHRSEEGKHLDRKEYAKLQKVFDENFDHAYMASLHATENHNHELDAFVRAHHAADKIWMNKDRWLKERDFRELFLNLGLLEGALMGGIEGSVAKRREFTSTDFGTFKYVIDRLRSLGHMRTDKEISKRLHRLDDKDLRRQNPRLFMQLDKMAHLAKGQRVLYHP